MQGSGLLETGAFARAVTPHLGEVAAVGPRGDVDHPATQAAPPSGGTAAPGRDGAP